MTETTKTEALPVETTDKRDSHRAEERRRMGEAVAALRSSEGWQRWLKVRRHFHSYSFQNQLLIALQRPDATRVAGFKRWLALGYRVRRGEHGIRIWAPCPPSKKRLRAWAEEGADPARKPRTFFRMVAVFDRSQVDPLPDFPGEPLELDPPVEPMVGAGLAPLLSPLRQFAASIGSKVEITAIAGSARGYFEPKTKRIAVEARGPDFSTNAQVAVLVHEISHALIADERDRLREKLTYAEEEVVVESVAHSVCASAGLDTAGSSVPYLASWSEADVELTVLESHAQLIDALAKRIETALIDTASPEPRSLDTAPPTDPAPPGEAARSPHTSVARSSTASTPQGGSPAPAAPVPPSRSRAVPGLVNRTTSQGGPK
jgi:antirestriction protein ArdC